MYPGHDHHNQRIGALDYCPHGNGTKQQCSDCLLADANAQLQWNLYSSSFQHSATLSISNGPYTPASPASHSTSSAGVSPPSSSSYGSSWMQWNTSNPSHPPGNYSSFPESHTWSTEPSPPSDFRQQIGSVTMTTTAISNRKLEPKFFCDVPGCTSQGFTEKHNYLYHMRSHEVQRPYMCERCGKSFRAQGDLTRHLYMSKKRCERKPY
ncbi:hypothetical protein L218DRAFT_623564 [Marasmius fiardii PR-910]|nr:hypothetical protein L218DRAFT_623564 [Marasmius fiardii PR-910]